MEVVDFFSGFGGFSEGFKQHHQHLFGIDNNEKKLVVYRLNHGTAYCRDLSDVRSIVKMFDDIDSDHLCIIASCPCQGYSRANRFRTEREEKNNQLVESFFDILDELRPAWFVTENVIGARKRIIENARRLGFGYHLLPLVLNSKDFGVAQARKRFFLIGSKYTRPLFIHRKAVPIQPPTVGDVIKDCSSVPRVNTRDHVLERSKNLRQGDYLYNYSNVGYRLKADGLSPTFSANHNNIFFHPTENRRISVPEVAAIMGFPRSYILPLDYPITTLYDGLGQAVCPPVADAIARNIF